MGDLPITQIVSQRPQIQLATRDVPPPAAYYIGAGNFLRISLFSSQSSVVIRIVWRMLLPDSTIIQNAQDLVTNSNRAEQVAFIPLTEGFILSIVAYAPNTSLRRGMAYVRCAVTQSNNVSISIGNMGELLCQGYIESNALVAYPGGANGYGFEARGNIRSITGSTPAAGANISETVPTSAMWALYAFRFSLTTSAAVATRNVVLLLDDGTSTFSHVVVVTSQAASLAYNYAFNAGNAVNAFIAPNLSLGFSPLMYIPGGFRIRTSVLNMDAGDQFAAPQYLVEEWLTP